MKKHIVIIGGGFGGTYTAKGLKSLIENDSVEVTLINRENYFLFTPLLHEVATGGLNSTNVVEPIQEIFRHSNVHFVQDEVRSIDPLSQQVTTSMSTFPYDYLVVSSGAETNYYGIPGAEKNTFVLKNLDDAIAIRRHLLSACEKASLINDDEQRTLLLSSVIVGAGATGVELAAELIEFMHETLCSYYKMCEFQKEHMKVTLVAASPDVLPQFPEKLRKIAYLELVRKGVSVMTNIKVTGVEPEKILFGENSSIQAHTIIWVAGVKPITMEILGSEKEKNGRMKVDQFLRVAKEGGVFENIFALGDVSGICPQLAQVAVQQGRTVAFNIGASIDKVDLSAFIYKGKGLLVSLGQWYAAGKIYGVVMKGPFMWWLWRTIYLFNFHSWKKRVRIALDWTINIFSPRDITKI